MTLIPRSVEESPIEQGADEAMVYYLTTTPWGSGPSGIQVKAYDVTGGTYTEVSLSVLSGSPGASGDVITLPVLGSLTAGNIYKLEIKFTCGSNTFEAWLIVQATQ